MKSHDIDKMEDLALQPCPRRLATPGHQGPGDETSRWITVKREPPLSNVEFVEKATGIKLIFPLSNIKPNRGDCTCCKGTSTVANPTPNVTT